MYKVKIPHMDLFQIANSGQCFRWQQIDNNTYKIPTFGKELIISQDGDIFTLSCNEDEWNRIWKNYFDVDTDTNYDEIEDIIMNINDKFLKSAYEFGNGIRILRQDLWETIISFIISQRNNIPRIKKCIKELCKESNGSFPNYEELYDIDLSDKGLGYRDKYIKDACKWWIKENKKTEFDLNLLDNPKEYLKEIKGIGDKIANCICLFSLHKLDSFPIDTHINNIINREYNGKLPEWINNKYAGLFQQYIFYFELNQKPL